MAYCDEYLELISAAIDGALSPNQQAKLEAHLAQCPDCRTLYEEMKTIHDTLAGLPPAEVPVGLTERIMEAVAADKVIPLVSTKKKKAPIRWQRWAVAAAAAVVLVGVGALQTQQPPKSAESRMIAPASFPSPQFGAYNGDIPATEGVEADSSDLVSPKAYVATGAPESDQTPAESFAQRGIMESAGIIPSLGALQNTADDSKTADAEAPVVEAVPELTEGGMTEAELAAMEQVRIYLGLSDDYIWDGGRANVWTGEAWETRLAYSGLLLDEQYYCFELYDTPLFIEDPAAGTRFINFYAVPVEGGEVLECNGENFALFSDILFP